MSAAALHRHIARVLEALTDAPKNCQNELAPDYSSSPAPGEVARLAEPEGVLRANCQNEPVAFPTPAPPQSRRDFPSLEISPALQSRDKNCRNEPASASSFLSPPELGAGGPSSSSPIRISALRNARKLKQQQKRRDELGKQESPPAPANFLGAAGVS